jgi:fatty acid desaturase
VGRGGVTGDWRKLHNDEHHNDAIKEDEMDGALSAQEMKNVYKILIESLRRRGHLEDLGVKVDIIKMYLKEIRIEGVDWILVNTVINVPVP